MLNMSRYMSSSLNSLKGIGLIKGDTRSLNYSSYIRHISNIRGRRGYFNISGFKGPGYQSVSGPMLS